MNFSTSLWRLRALLSDLEEGSLEVTAALRVDLEEGLTALILGSEEVLVGAATPLMVDSVVEDREVLMGPAMRRMEVASAAFLIFAFFELRG